MMRLLLRIPVYATCQCVIYLGIKFGKYCTYCKHFKYNLYLKYSKN